MKQSLHLIIFIVASVLVSCGSGNEARKKEIDTEISSMSKEMNDNFERIQDNIKSQGNYRLQIIELIGISPDTDTTSESRTITKLQQEIDSLSKVNEGIVIEIKKLNSEKENLK